ncbi:alpha/beta hydrolase [Peristeroidobacter soli]|jgi:predicted alpha/beta superfamily hydrolase|uniref:alpha/beta hydrolase n=1 Tax=Peristeroidobacter soli TaxID=2497877 RepID=UPI00101CEE53|nr:alpha/beta hydrolase-fold protein [Peristeroidobacter soli]
MTKFSFDWGKGSRALVILAVALVGWAGGASAAEVLPNVEIREMVGKDNGRRYQIYTALPAKPQPEEGYSVVYVLDANIMFATMVETVRASERRPTGRGTVVIGIGYPDDLKPNVERTLDLTPALTSTPKQGTGGAESFLRFIENELKPEVAARFKIDTTRETLFGHSYGGLFTLYALINAPGLVDNFVAASPSIWYEGRMMQKANVRGRLEPKVQTQQVTPRVLITVGEYEQTPDPDFPAVQGQGSNPDILKERQQVDNAREFADYLSKIPGVEAKFVMFPGEDHGTVIPGAISRGVRFALAPTVQAPTPAAKLVSTGKPPGGIKVPTAQEYLKLTADQRYKLRMRVRKLPEQQRMAWNQQFQYSLNAGLTYLQHRKLHEERQEMDQKHGTQPPPEG